MTWNITTAVLPVSGVGCDWPMTDLCGDDGADPAIVTWTRQMAAQIMWAATGRRYGVCTSTVRPCTKGCWVSAASREWWAAHTVPIGSWWRPWFACDCGDSCSCGAVESFRLPGRPISVVSVTIDGVVLDAENYKLRGKDLLRVDGLTWPSCFPAGTLVMARHGLVPIEDIRAGDQVLTHQGRWRAVLRAGQTGVRDTVTVKARGDLTCTPDHQIWNRATHYAYPSSHRRIFAQPTWDQAEDLRGRHVAIAEVMPDAEPVYPEGIEVTNRFWEFVGFWLGDGWVASGDGRIRLSVLKDRKVQRLRDLITAVPGTWRESVDHKGNHRFGLSSPKLAHWLTEQFGAGAHTKTIPAWMLGAPRHVREAFLAGLVASDGSVRIPREFRITTTSKAVAIGVRFLLGSLGTPGAAYHHKAGHWQLSWTPGPRVNPQAMTDELATWVRVRSVEPNSVAVPVYDIEVEEDHSFVADGYVVHNCQNWGADPGEVGSWEVEFTHGQAVPIPIQIASGLYQCELARALTPGSECALPERVTNIVRDGVSVAFMDPLNFLSDGLTGLPLVDAAILSDNPARLRQRPRAYRADGVRGAHRV